MRVLHVGDDHADLRPCGLTLYADALMRAQAARGHDVAYVFSGRHFPWFERPRLKRWRRGPVQMVELIGSPNHTHWEDGTRRPEVDLHEPAGERAFLAAVRDHRPDLVHVQELARLPSSILDLAAERGIPVVMALHDFKPVCASTRLLDADGARCTRLDVGADCARNCAGAPDGPEHLVDWTVRHERRRLRRALPFGEHLDRPEIAPAVGALTRALTRGADAGDARYLPPVPPAPPSPPEAYQRRRDVNVARLSRVDRLVAPSGRVAELYAALGVDPARIVVQRLTLPHLERLRPGPERPVGRPLRFVTLGGCSHPSKGSLAVRDALRALDGRDVRLDVWGAVDHRVHDELAAHPGVTLHGRYRPEDVDAALDGADVGLVPSVWEEAHGFVGIELLAKGVPVVGSALGGIPEYVLPGRTGWLNAGATGAELAAIMGRLLDDRGEVEALRRSVRAHREQVVRPMAEHVDEVEALYRELIGP